MAAEMLVRITLTDHLGTGSLRKLGVRSLTAESNLCGCGCGCG